MDLIDQNVVKRIFFFPYGNIPPLILRPLIDGHHVIPSEPDYMERFSEWGRAPNRFLLTETPLERRGFGGETH